MSLLRHIDTYRHFRNLKLAPFIKNFIILEIALSMLISSKENESHATYYFLILIILNTIFGAQHNMTRHATMILRFL